MPQEEERATSITYSDISMYLDAIGNVANNDPGQAIHKYWWHVGQDPGQPALAYNDFKTGTVFGIGVPIIGTDANQKDPLESAFYLVLKGGDSKYGPQMPQGGPYLTDANFPVQTINGQKLTGTQILANIAEWLGNGYPDGSADSPDPDTSA
jgi:hypothetical protein